MRNRSVSSHLSLLFSLQHLRDSSQERLALLEARLTEEKDWRKQLEVDLNAAQAALKKDKEVTLAKHHYCCMFGRVSLSFFCDLLQSVFEPAVILFMFSVLCQAVQIAEREQKKLKMEVNSLQTECQQGKTLIKSLTQVKGEKAVLEEKVSTYIYCIK